MLKKIQHFWLQRAFKKNKRKHNFLNIAQMKTIVVLFDIADKMEIILMAENLSEMGKKTILWTVEDKQSVNELNSINLSRKMRVLDKKDFSSLFILKNKIVKEFSTLNYDTLIDTRRTNNNIELEYLLALNKAQCSIGFRNNTYKTFDICFIGQGKKNILEIYEQMKYYLSKI